MDTVISFRGDASKIKEELLSVDNMQRSMATESLQRTIEEGLMKTRNTKDFLEFMREEQRLKRENISLSRLAADEAEKQLYHQNLQSAGPNASSRDLSTIESIYKEGLSTNKEAERIAKETLAVQQGILNVLQQEGREKAYSPEQAAQLREMGFGEGDDPFDTLSNEFGKSRLPSPGGGGGGGASGGMMGMLGKFIGPAAIGALLFSYGKTAYKSAFSAQTQDEYGISLLEGIPFVGEFLAAGERQHYEAKKDWLSESARSRGTYGYTPSRHSWANAYGYSSTELEREKRSLDRETGLFPHDWESIIASRRAFNLEDGEAVNLAKLGLFDQSGESKTSSFFAMLSDHGLGGNISNLYKGVTDITSQQGGITNSRENAKILTSLDNMFGTDPSGLTPWSGRRLNNMAGSMNQALMNPSSDFQKALNYKILSELPELQGKGWIDINIAQQKGMAQEGFMKASMEDIMKRGGSGSEKFGVESIMSRFGITDYQAARDLYQNYKNNPHMFNQWDSYESEEALKKGTEWRKLTGEANTSEYEKEIARTKEQYIDSATNAAFEKMENSEIGKAIKAIAATLTAFNWAGIPLHSKDQPGS